MPQVLPHVGIVILNWKRPEDTLACLGSLRDSDYPSFEVVVVDNGASVPLAQQIESRFPEVSYIRTIRNLGFAAGNNIGIQHLLDDGADYVLLLNDDTEVAPDLVRKLIEVAEEEPAAGVVGPMIYYYDLPDVIWSAGGAVNDRGEVCHLRVDERDDSPANGVRDVDYVTGCALLIKREVIEAVGLLDERFFAYFEETEWCARVRKAGYRVLFAPDARVWHKLQPSARSQSRLYIYLMARNRLLYLRSTGAGAIKILIASVSLLRTALSWAIRSQHREMRPLSSALVHGVCDFMVGRYGAPPLRP